MLVIEFNLNIYNLDFGTENIFPNRTEEIVSAARLGIQQLGKGLGIQQLDDLVASQIEIFENILLTVWAD